MQLWERQLAASITAPDELARHFHLDPEAMQAVASRYPLRITPHYLSLIAAPDDPIGRQCIPDLRELADDLLPDPLAEESLSPVPGLIHRYPDRVVWLVTNACAVYCRFCMRKRKVGCGGSTAVAPIDDVLAYLRANTTIRDVILSGGDPLLLADDTLADILAGLRAIKHLEIIRINSRVPVTLPSRITPQLCRMLRRFHPLYCNTHFNHPREVTPESSRACARLAEVGIPLGNQTVLLKGVNDEPQVMGELLKRLLAIRVKPYYIHQLDLVRGTGHFRTPLAAGLAILNAVRGHTSGLAAPHYVIDLPGGKGKVPLLPEQVKWCDDRLEIRTYKGETVSYPLLPGEVRAPLG